MRARIQCMVVAGAVVSSLAGCQDPGASTGSATTAPDIGDTIGGGPCALLVRGRECLDPPRKVMLGSATRGRLLSTDINGDGRDELVTGDGTVVSDVMSGSPEVASVPIQQDDEFVFSVGDFDGDGNDDLVGQSAGHLFFYRSNGKDNFEPWFSFDSGYGDMWGLVGSVADFDGDGKDDLAIFARDHGEIALYLARDDFAIPESVINACRGGIIGTGHADADDAVDLAWECGGLLEIRFGDGAGGFLSSPASLEIVTPTAGSPVPALHSADARGIAFTASGGPLGRLSGGMAVVRTGAEGDDLVADTIDTGHPIDDIAAGAVDQSGNVQAVGLYHRVEGAELVMLCEDEDQFTECSRIPLGVPASMIAIVESDDPDRPGGIVFRSSEDPQSLWVLDYRP